MKKVFFLVGLLGVFNLGYAAKEDSFNVHAKVVKPVGVEVSGESVEFGELIAGTGNQESKQGVKIKVTGEEGKAVKISYELDEKEIEYGRVNLISKVEADSKPLQVVLYEGKSRGDVLKTNTFTLSKLGKEFEVNGYIWNGVPEDAVSGDYYSKDITVKVQYE